MEDIGLLLWAIYGSGIGDTGLFGGRYSTASLEDGGKRLVAVTICVLYRALVKEI